MNYKIQGNKTNSDRHTYGNQEPVSVMKQISLLTLLSLLAVFLMAGCPVSADSVEELIRIGQNFNQAGQTEKAIDAYNQALKIEPNNTWALDNRAYLLGNLARWEESVSAFESALNKSPENVELWQGKGYALNKLKRYEEAIPALDQVFALNYKVKPANWIAETWLQKAQALHSLGRSEEAIEAFDLAIKNDPKYAKVLNEKGIVLMNLTRYDEALQTFNQALNISPRYGDALKNKKIAESKISK